MILLDTDRSFVHRWVTQCIAQRSPHLQQEAVALASRIGVPTNSSLESPDFQEHCPACKALIPLGHSSTAACLKGHVWGNVVFPDLF